jgi:hypothetical protein
MKAFRGSARAACLCAALLVIASRPGGQAPAGVGAVVPSPIPLPNADRDLRGAIDIHVHGNPDSVPRVGDGIELAKQAASRGMRGIVLKNHFDPTAGLAYLARKAVPGLEVLGGVDLNLPVGGMNPNAVDYMAKMNGGFGRIVWMSTFDSENGMRGRPGMPFVRVARNGALLPETNAVIAAIARHNFVLASGHVSADEAMMMFREGRRAGVQHMVATHGMSSPTFLSLAQAKEATSLGVFIEFCGDNLALTTAQSRIDTFSEQIRGIGTQFTILSSDLGKADAPLPTVGLAMFYEMLRKKGFTNEELDRMGKQNPATLLGLK